MPDPTNTKASAGSSPAFVWHWPEYLMEAAELGLFMLAACTFGTLLRGTDLPLGDLASHPFARRVYMGVAMGMTASAVIISPFGRRSGAHLNPLVSFTFFCLGRMHWLDATFYAISQFLGGALGVLLARTLIGTALASPSVRYVVTVPGRFGILAAFCAECFMGLLTMSVALHSANHPRLSRFTWLLIGLLVSMYVIVFSPISGFSLNPARSVSSALFANIWTSIWIYFSAPLLGMLAGAGLYIATRGADKVYCAKIYHDASSSCPFYCRYSQLHHKEQ